MVKQLEDVSMTWSTPTFTRTISKQLRSARLEHLIPKSNSRSDISIRYFDRARFIDERSRGIISNDHSLCSPSITVYFPVCRATAAPVRLFFAQRDQLVGGELHPRRGRWLPAILSARGARYPEEHRRRSGEPVDAARAAKRSGNGRRGTGDISGEKSKAELSAARSWTWLRLHVVRVRGERARKERAGVVGARPRRRRYRRESWKGRLVPGGSEEGTSQGQLGKYDHRYRLDRYR